MQKINTLFISVIQFLSLFDSTKQSNARLALTTLKAIGKTIKSPLLKQIGNTIKNPIIKTFGNTIKKSLNTLRQNQNTIKNIGQGMQAKYLKNVHNFGSKSVKYLGAKGIKKFKYTAPQAVRSGKHLFRTEGKKNIQMKSSTQMSGKELRSVVRRSAEQMKEKGLGSLINMASKTEPWLTLLLAAGGLNKLTQCNLVYAEDGSFVTDKDWVDPTKKKSFLNRMFRKILPLTHADFPKPIPEDYPSIETRPQEMELKEQNEFEEENFGSDTPYYEDYADKETDVDIKPYFLEGCMEFDLIVIGGGSGGLSVGQEAAIKYGKKVCIVDFVKPSPQGGTWGEGGTCVNVGCIPKKLLHYSSLLGEQIKDLKEAGWTLEGKQEHSWDKMIKAVNNYVYSLNWGYKMKYLHKNITYINETGSFIDAHTIKVRDKDRNQRYIKGKNVVIAVGGRPSYVDIPGMKEHAITSDDLFWKKEAPGKTLCIGAGYIAMECGGFLQSLNNPVTVLVRSKPLRNFDQDMAQRAVTSMKNLGVKFVTGFDSSKGGNVVKLGNGRLKVTYHAKDGEVTESYDTILMAAGRGADTEGLNLEAVGIKYNEKNKIIVDDSNKTSLDDVYAIGDVIENSPELTPVAMKEGKLLADRLFGGKTKKMDYDNIPTTIFTPLEYGMVGLSEESAEEKYGTHNIEVYHTSFKPLEWSFLDMTNKPHPDNLCYSKVVCLKEDNDRVLGVHYVGPNAGEVIQGYAVAVKAGVKWETFVDTVGIHPTCSENIVDMYITKREQKEVTKDGC